MNEFEKACHTENYTGVNTQECVIEWIRGDKEVTVTFANKTRYNSKVRKLAEDYPNDVKIVADNKDGSIVAHMPLRFITISKPRRNTLTEEQKRKASERLQNSRQLNK